MKGNSHSWSFEPPCNLFDGHYAVTKSRLTHTEVSHEESQDYMEREMPVLSTDALAPSSLHLQFQLQSLSNCSLKRDPKPGLRSWALPQFLTHRNCHKPLRLKVICTQQKTNEFNESRVVLCKELWFGSQAIWVPGSTLANYLLCGLG